MGYVVYVLQPSGATGFGQEFSAVHVNDWGKTTTGEIIEGTKKFLKMKIHEITRQLLEKFLECRHPVNIITKSHLVLRDLDLLSELAERRLCSVAISIPTLRGLTSGIVIVSDGRPFS